MKVKDALLAEIDYQINQGNRLLDSYRMSEGGYESSIPESEFRTFAIGALHTVKRIAGGKSEFYRQIPKDELGGALNSSYSTGFMSSVIGSLRALRIAVDAGLLIGLESRLRANIHVDFLEQAKELMSATPCYHVPAMVLVGCVLEDHLRKLADANGWPASDKGSLSKFNDFLRDTVYPQTAWRRIQSIADYRNLAAHGRGSELKPEDVSDSLAYVERHLADYPA